MFESSAHILPARVASSALLAIVVLGGTAQAQPTSRDPQFEAVVERELQAVAPGAVTTFRAATAAMDAGREADAVPLFQTVIGQAPQFSPALRRLGHCLVELGRRDEAFTYLEDALRIERTAENLAALVRALLWTRSGETPSLAYAERALSLAREAATRNRDERDPSYLAMVAHISISLNRVSEARVATQDLMTRFPEQPTTYYFAAVLAAMDGDWTEAQRRIGEAQRLGLPPEMAEEFLDSGVRTRARVQRAMWWTLGLVAAWATGLIVLFAAGKALSRRTLRSLQSQSVDADVTPGERSLRQTYRRLIAIAGGYYYVSLPFVMAGIAVVAALIILFFMALGWMPVVLMWALILGGLLTMFRIVQTLFITVPPYLPGRRLEREEAVGLWELTVQVAQAVGTRAIDEIRITPGTEMAVYEQGTRAERRDDRGRRVLIIGIGLLEGFRQGPFCAVLAHEYGHFAHRDTAGGDIALRVRQDMQKLAVALVNSGQAVRWNVACHFLRLYDFLFRRIAFGATRLQEVLADRVAARRYGADNFEEGLRHVVRRDIEFGAALQREVQEAVGERRPLRNVYASETVVAGVDDAIDEALSRPTEADDTHPSPIERFDRVRGTPASGSTPQGFVWDLFADRSALVGEMLQGFNTQISPVIEPDPVSTPA